MRIALLLVASVLGAQIVRRSVSADGTEALRAEEEAAGKSKCSMSRAYKWDKNVMRCRDDRGRFAKTDCCALHHCDQKGDDYWINDLNHKCYANGGLHARRDNKRIVHANCCICQPDTLYKWDTDGGKCRTVVHDQFYLDAPAPCCAVSAECPRQCVKCDRGGQCTACGAGFYGPRCKDRCPRGCAGSCNQDGTCAACQDGFFGPECDKCPRNCAGGCDGEGRCEACQPGFHGDTCWERCPRNCDGACGRDGQCASCQPGFFGGDCSKACPSNCDGACDEAGVCASCRSGHFGAKCDQACPSNCDGACDAKGRCSSCQPGFHGPRCTQCHASCKTCDGPGADKCTSCHAAAHVCEAPGLLDRVFGDDECDSARVGQCRCIEGAQRHKGKPLQILGTTIKETGQCYCKPNLFKSPAGKAQCVPGCPSLMSRSFDRCYPNAVVVEATQCARGGDCPVGEKPTGGLCENGERLLTFAEPLCLDMAKAAIVYEHTARIEPAPQAGRPSELCPGTAQAKITKLCLPENYFDHMVRS